MGEVWIIEAGQVWESGTIYGVYSDKALAVAEFEKDAATIGIPDARVDENGNGYASTYTDWVTLSRHDVKGA